MWSHKRKKTKKIVEVGISNGGTTSCIIKTVMDFKLDSDVYGVDISKVCYRNSKYESGFLAKEVAKDLDFNKLHIFTGDVVASFLDDIAKNHDIDFLILDTTHSVPGEILEFIVCYPFLTSNATVVLHDVGMNLISNNTTEHATKVLFDVVSADKYMLNLDFTGLSFPNIAAFQLNNRTPDSLNSLFSSLSLSWEYLIDDLYLAKYLSFIKKYYSEAQYSYLVDLLKVQEYRYFRNFLLREFGVDFMLTNEAWKNTNNKIVIYGAGSSGKSIYKYAKICGLRVDAIACSDEYPKPTKDFLDIPVYYISELPFKPSECSFVIASEKKFQTQIKKNLLKYNYYSLL